MREVLGDKDMVRGEGPLALWPDSASRVDQVRRAVNLLRMQAVFEMVYDKSWSPLEYFLKIAGDIWDFPMKLPKGLVGMESRQASMEKKCEVMTIALGRLEFEAVLQAEVLAPREAGWSVGSLLRETMKELLDEWSKG
jgi:hypothetical protein